MSGREDTGHRHAHMIIILVSVMIGLVIGTIACNTPGQTTTSAEAQDGATAGQLETEFTSVAERVLPAVVRINVEAGAGAQAPGGEAPDMEQIPEQFREFFRQFPFFGDPGEDGDGGMQPMPPPRREGIGSGWIYSADGYIVTNAHVVANAERVTVVLHDQEEDEEQVEATVVGRDPRTDLAVLKVDVGRDLPYLQLGDSENLKVASWVMAVGAPLELEQTVTVGVVSAKSRIIEPDPTMPYLRLGDIIQTDASINPGNSGGPLVNMRGEVVGINVAYAAPGRIGNIGIGFAIAASTAESIVPRLIEGQEIARGWLGVRIEDLTENLEEFYGVDYGVRIAGIDDDAPAADSELQVDDIVIAAEGRPVRETWDLQQVVAESEPGSTIELTVVRNKQEATIDVTLGSMPVEYTGLPAGETPEEEERREWPLGIAAMPMSELTPEIGRQLGIEAGQGVIVGLDRNEGAVVRSLQPGSPAAGKVAPGDVVDRVNGTAVTTVQEYREQMEAAMDADQDFVVLHLTRVIEGDASTRVVDIELP
ncbi:MAG: trypsin-like peptidase domain-containing protein [Armatimonadota bacterium]